MPKNCRGMTLIEVLVAFVVLALTLTVIMRIFSGGLRNAGVADGYTRALYLAESKLAAAGVEKPLLPGEEMGQVGEGMRWRLSVNPYDAGGGANPQPMPATLYEVRAQVAWGPQNRERKVELSTLRLAVKTP